MQWNSIERAERANDVMNDTDRNKEQDAITILFWSAITEESVRYEMKTKFLLCFCIEGLAL